jgi:hypothetical protein
MHSECSESFLASPQYLGICKVRHLSRSGGFTGRGVQRDLRRPNHEDEEAGWVLAGWTVETVLRAGESGGDLQASKTLAGTRFVRCADWENVDRAIEALESLLARGVSTHAWEYGDL